EGVSDAALLVRALVGEPAPAPRLVAVPRAAAALDELARALEDLVLPLLRCIRIGDEQDLVLGAQLPDTSSSLGLRRLRLPALLGKSDGAGRSEKRRAV